MLLLTCASDRALLPANRAFHRPKALGFSNSVGELRYEPTCSNPVSAAFRRSYTKEPRAATGSAGVAAADPFPLSAEARWQKGKASWRSLWAPLPFNSRRHVFGDHRGHRNMEATAEISSEVGTCGTVKVFSNSAHTWCEGRIEKQTKDRVKVAYQLPRAHAKEWITKEFVIGNTDLQAEGAGSRLDLDAVDRQSQVPTARRSKVQTPRAAPLLALDTERPSRSPQGFQSTKLPRYWTEEEQSLYDDLFSKFGRPGTGGVGATGFPDALREATGLKPAVLEAAWQVANPNLSSSPGLREFRSFFRLVGHCQAMVRDGRSGAQGCALKRGGGAMRALLRAEEALDRCPPVLIELALVPVSSTGDECEKSVEAARESFDGRAGNL